MTPPSFENPDLLFDPGTHTYRLASDPDVLLTSVTEVCDQYSRGFDSAKASAAVAIRRGVTPAEVLAEWKIIGERACDLGHVVHAEAERIALALEHGGDFSLRRPCEPDLQPYFSAVQRFYADHIGVSYGYAWPEVRIASLRHQIAGSVDLVCNLDGVPSIVDFKSVRRLGVISATKMYAPFNHLPDTNYWHYVCQLNIYAYLLAVEHDYWAAESLWIVWLRSDGQYRRVYVPNIQDVVEMALLRRERSRKRKAKRGSASRFQLDATEEE